MTPGYYIVVRDAVLISAKHRLRLHKGDWLITDGIVVGRFDQAEELDWVPLEWVRNIPVIVDAEVSDQLDHCIAAATPQKLEVAFHKLVFVEPGEPMPDLPRPPLGQLEPYLRRNRSLVAMSYTYDWR